MMTLYLEKQIDNMTYELYNLTWEEEYEHKRVAYK